MKFIRVEYGSLLPGFQIELYDEWTMIIGIFTDYDLSIIIYTENGIIDLPASKRHEKINVRYDI